MDWLQTARCVKTERKFKLGQAWKKVNVPLVGCTIFYLFLIVSEGGEIFHQSSSSSSSSAMLQVSVCCAQQPHRPQSFHLGHRLEPQPQNWSRTANPFGLSGPWLKFISTEMAWGEHTSLYPTCCRQRSAGAHNSNVSIVRHTPTLPSACWLHSAICGDHAN